MTKRTLNANTKSGVISDFGNSLLNKLPAKSRRRRKRQLSKKRRTILDGYKRIPRSSVL